MGLLKPLDELILDLRSQLTGPLLIGSCLVDQRAESRDTSRYGAIILELLQ